jgi:hypothetical protein
MTGKNMTFEEILELSNTSHSIAIEEAIFNDSLEVRDLAGYLYENAHRWYTTGDARSQDRRYETIVNEYYEKVAEDFSSLDLEDEES